jgi:hypothetical protein
MAIASPDNRGVQRRAADELIAGEPLLPIPDLPPGTIPAPIETHLGRRRRPIAMAGVIENGLVRLLDPAVKLAEHTRVIVVASEAG